MGKAMGTLLAVVLGVAILAPPAADARTSIRNFSVSQNGRSITWRVTICTPRSTVVRLIAYLHPDGNARSRVRPESGRFRHRAGCGREALRWFIDRNPDSWTSVWSGPWDTYLTVLIGSRGQSYRTGWRTFYID